MSCPHYGGCLNESVSQGWESFSCMQCPHAAQAPEHGPPAGAYAHERKGGRFD